MQSSNVENRSFLGAIAAAIKSIAALIIDLVSVGQEGVGMLETSVKAARKQQVIQVAAKMSDFAVLTLKRAAVDQAKAHEAVENYVAGSAVRKQLVEEAHARIKAAVDADLAALEAKRSGQ
jgi:transaldolase